MVPVEDARPLLGQVARHSDTQHLDKNNRRCNTAQLFKQTKSTGKDLIGHAYFSLRAFICGQNTQHCWCNCGVYVDHLVQR